MGGDGGVDGWNTLRAVGRMAPWWLLDVRLVATPCWLIVACLLGKDPWAIGQLGVAGLRDWAAFWHRHMGLAWGWHVVAVSIRAP